MSLCGKVEESLRYRRENPTPRKRELKRAPGTPEFKAHARLRHVTRTFGIESEDYLAMKAAQEGKCAICGEEDPTRELSVDHDHKTGRVRNLLCNRCNFGIGYFRENPAILASAIEYLKRWGK
jgi:hypothetical protein